MNKDKNLMPTELTPVLKEYFLGYSEYVILDRALPDVRDGLKLSPFR